MMGERSERRDGAWTEEMELTEESEPGAWGASSPRRRP
jgi:hypothetical protein